MKNFLIKSVTTKYLKKDQILNICKLKNSYWKYGVKKILDWFKKKVKKNDIHNLILLNSKIIGYNLLRKRIFFIKNKRKKYFYFDTLIIDKKFRNMKLSSKLLKLNNKVLKKKKLHAFLVCQKKHFNYYKKFKWKKIRNSNFLISDHKFLKNKYIAMVNNFKNYTFNQKYIYYFDKTI